MSDEPANELQLCTMRGFDLLWSLRDAAASSQTVQLVALPYNLVDKLPGMPH